MLLFWRATAYKFIANGSLKFGRNKLSEKNLWSWKIYKSLTWLLRFHSFTKINDFKADECERLTSWFEKFPAWRFILPSWGWKMGIITEQFSRKKVTIVYTLTIKKIKFYFFLYTIFLLLQNNALHE